MSNQGHSLEHLFEQYREQRNAFTDLHRKVQEIAATATSPRKEVSVTVNHGGSLTDISFAGTAYKRMSSKDLSALILRTFQDAREKAFEESAALIAPLMPAGLNARELVAGRLGMDTLVPADGPRLPASIREHLQRTEP